MIIMKLQLDESTTTVIIIKKAGILKEYQLFILSYFLSNWYIKIEGAMRICKVPKPFWTSRTTLFFLYSWSTTT
jgi:hypothetical protein